VVRAFLIERGREVLAATESDLTWEGLVEVTTYHATVSLDGRFWFIEVAELGRSTQARNLGEVETMTRDLIAVMTETEPNSFDLDIKTKLPEQAAEHWRRSQQLRAESDRRKTEAAQEARLDD